jgi:uncharacterized protein (TIGR03437 family)
VVLRATFTNLPITMIDSDPPGLVVNIDGVQYLTPRRFTWASATDHAISLSDVQDNIAGAQFQFLGWDDGGTTSARTISAQSAPVKYVARFKTRYFLSLDWYGAGRLTTDPPTNDGFFDAGTTVQINSLPSGNRVVQYWLGDTLGGGESKTLLMDQNHTATAVFGLPLNFRPLHGGSYSANPVFDEPGTAVAPLEIVTLFGDNLGPETLVGGQLDSNGRVSTQLANTRVLFDQVPAPILYASSKQTSVIVPQSAAGRFTTTIVIERNGVVTGAMVADVEPSLPGVFTADASGRGAIAALNENGSLNTRGNPAGAGSVVAMYASGAGLMDGTFADGAIATGLSRPRLPVYVRVGGKPADLFYAGAAPGLVQGAIQINFRIPEGLPAGEVPVQLIFGNYASPPGTTISVR